MRVCVTTQAVTRVSGKGLQRAAVLYSACRLDSSELKSPNNWTSPQPWGTPAGPEREQSQPQKSNFPPFLLSVLSAVCFEMCHKVFYLFSCGCEWRVMIHTKEQALMFWVCSSLSTNIKRSCWQKGNILCIDRAKELSVFYSPTQVSQRRWKVLHHPQPTLIFLLFDIYPLN